MKVLTAGNHDLLVFPMTHSDAPAGFEACASGALHTTGIVADVPESRVRAAADSLAARDQFIEPRDVMRDLRFIAKNLVEVPVGTEGIAAVHRGARSRVEIPADALPERAAPEAGDVVAVGANISPRALMNARAVVIAVNGARVTAKLTEGDRRRIEIATGKRFAAEVRLPLACVEVDAECLVEVA